MEKYLKMPNLQFIRILLVLMRVFGYTDKNLKGKKQSVFVTDADGMFSIYGLKSVIIG